MYLDFKLQPKAKVTQHVTQGWTAFVYVIENDVCLGKGTHQINFLSQLFS